MSLSPIARQIRTRLLPHLLLLGALIPIMALSACTKAQAKVDKPAEPVVKTIAVRAVAIHPRDIHQTIDYIGTVRFRDEVKVSARVGGTIGQQLIATGATVEKDTTLTHIETPELTMRLRGAKAELRRLKTQESHACSIAATDKKLVDRGALTQARANASQTSCDSARHAVAAATSKRDEITLSIGHTTLNSTSSGLLLQWLKETGETVGPGHPVIIIGAGPKEVEVQVTERDIAKGVLVGTTARISTVSGTEIPATVDRISPMAKGPGRHVAVRLLLDRSLAALPSGSALNVRFVLQSELATTSVPARALINAKGTQKAIFVAQDGVASKRTVEVGIAENGWVAITPPLEPGALVVTTNLGMLSDGASIMAVQDSTEHTQQ